MRANIPRESKPRQSTELEGKYLAAMQSISASLMNVLPSSDRLWDTLARVEALLLEAQMTGTPIEELFPKGGIAAFCQSIIDEYKAEEGIAAADTGKKPAAKDKKVSGKTPKKTPRGGVNATRYRRMTRFLAVIAILIAVAAFGYLSGFYRYVIQGSAYYHEELYNFENTVMETRGEPLCFEVPLTQMMGLNTVLYADGEGHTISLASVGSHERTVAGKNEAGGTTVTKVESWYIVLHYTVDAGFTRIRTVTPTPEGSGHLSLPDGSVYETTLVSDSSGPLERGWEYVQITVMEIPAGRNLKDATVTVTMDPPTYRVWERIGMGER